MAEEDDASSDDDEAQIDMIVDMVRSRRSKWIAVQVRIQLTASTNELRPLESGEAFTAAVTDPRRWDASARAR